MEKNNLTIPYIVFESVMDKADRRDKRNILIIAFLVLLLVITNIAWLFVWNSYDYVDGYEVQVDSEGNGNANYIGNDGDIYNGESYSEKNEDKDSE